MENEPTPDQLIQPDEPSISIEDEEAAEVVVAPPLPPPASLPAEYFHNLYQLSPDPFNFERSQYDADRHAAALAALPRQTYQTALEVGCSIGVFTEKLAARCADLLAIDVSQLALQRAKIRCRALPQVHFGLYHVPHDFPAGRFDLIVFSEVGYYFNMEDLLETRNQLISHLAPGAHLLLVHWTEPVSHHPLSGDAVHDTFLEQAGPELRHLGSQPDPYHRLDLFERV